MSSQEAFDPYHTWLGIPSHEQPPNHYRLLGLQLFESNLTVIENAADRQMAHVRTFQTGPRAAESQRLLSEIAAASRVLVTRAKDRYDAELRQQVNVQSTLVRPVVPLVVPAVPVVPPPVAVTIADRIYVPVAGFREAKRPALWRNIGITAAGAIMLVAALLSLLRIGSRDASLRPRQPAAVKRESVAANHSSTPTRSTSWEKPATASELKVAPNVSVRDEFPIATAVSEQNLVTFVDFTAAPKVSGDTLVWTCKKGRHWSALAADAASEEVAGKKGVKLSGRGARLDGRLLNRCSQCTIVCQLLLPDLQADTQVLRENDANGEPLGVVCFTHGQLQFHSWHHQQPGHWMHVSHQSPPFSNDTWHTIVIRWSSKSAGSGKVELLSNSERLVLDCQLVNHPSIGFAVIGGKVGFHVSEFLFFERLLSDAEVGAVLSGHRPEVSPDVAMQKNVAVQETVANVVRPLKLPIPHADIQREIRDKLDSDLKLPANAPVPRRQRLAQQLLLLSNGSQQPAEVYVLKLRASELMAESGELEGALKLIDDLSAEFDINAITAQHLLIKRLLGTKPSAEQVDNAVQMCQDLISTAERNEEFDVAASIAGTIVELAALPGADSHRKTGSAIKERADRLLADWQAFRQAEDRLRADPSDVEAAGTVGRWLCLVRGNWDQGLKHLTACSDPKIAELAQLDVVGAHDVDAMTKLGDAWSEFASGGPNNSPFSVRSRHWYLKALPLATGLDKVRLERRLKIGRP